MMCGEPEVVFGAGFQRHGQESAVRFAELAPRRRGDSRHWGVVRLNGLSVPVCAAARGHGRNWGLRPKRPPQHTASTCVLGDPLSPGFAC